MFLTGDFIDREAAIHAVVSLKDDGFTSSDVAVFSDEPVEFPRGVLDRSSHMSFAVVIGAITSCLLVIGFVYFTQYNYPIVTGGMPIFSFWATGVVFYELTMFGAIVTTFFWFLWESGILRRGLRAPVPLTESGLIGLRVQCTSDRADAVRKSLESAGARNIRTMDEGR